MCTGLKTVINDTSDKQSSGVASDTAIPSATTELKSARLHRFAGIARETRDGSTDSLSCVVLNHFSGPTELSEQTADTEVVATER